MTYKTIILALALPLSLATAGGCANDNADPTPEEVIEPVDEAATATGAQRADFVDEARERIAEIDREIEAWEREAEQAGEQAESASSDAMQALRAARDAAEKSITEVAEASAEKYDELEGDASSAMTDLEEAYNAVLEKMQTE